MFSFVTQQGEERHHRKKKKAIDLGISSRTGAIRPTSTEERKLEYRPTLHRRRTGNISYEISKSHPQARINKMRQQKPIQKSFYKRKPIPSLERRN